MYEFNEKLKALTPYAPAEAEGMIRLDANESFLPLPEDALREVGEALSRVEFNRYPDPAAKELCKAFAEYYGVPAECVAAGNGSDELITVLFSGFLQKGEAYATVEPDFSMYSFNGFVQEARHVALQKTADFQLDIDKLIETCNNEEVKLLIFSNPCNPTSVVCPREELRRLVRGVKALVVLDEAYMDFSGQSLLPEVQEYENLVILRTCSKAIGMAALRLGFAVARKELISAVRAVKSPYNVNTVSQLLGTAVLRRKDALERARREILRSQNALVSDLKQLEKRFSGRFRLMPGETNFAALVLPEGEALYRFLWEQGIAVRYTGGLLRVTCGKTEENKAFCAALERWLQK